MERSVGTRLWKKGKSVTVGTITKNVWKSVATRGRLTNQIFYEIHWPKGVGGNQLPIVVQVKDLAVTLELVASSPLEIHNSASMRRSVV